MPFFTSLPTEVVQQILEYLQPRNFSLTSYDSKRLEPNRTPGLVESRQGLASLARTSRRLTYIAQPLLYGQIVLKDTSELPKFFRTLAKDPSLRGKIHSFALLTSITRDVDLDQAWKDDFYATTHWPTGQDRYIASACGVIEDWTFPNLLVIVLALMPKLNHLYLFLSDASDDLDLEESDKCNYPVELLVLKNLFRDALFPRQRRNVTEIPSSQRFLQELSTIILEPASGENNMRRDKLRGLALTLPVCKGLRRVELKGDTVLTKRFLGEPDLDWDEMKSLPVPFGQNVVELIMVRMSNIHLNMSNLVNYFPHLRKFIVECNDSTEGHNPSNFKDRFEICLARLNKSLEYLTVTGNPTKTCEWVVRHFPSMLAPGIHEMGKLKHLMTDCTWLFGSEDMVEFPKIISHLPASLVSLYLVDHWGVSVDGPTDSVDHAPEEDKHLQLELEYYPTFKITKKYETALEFFEEIFRMLSTSCQTRNRSLTHITFASPCFNDVAGGFTKSPGWNAPETQEFVSKLTARFGSLGISFSCVTLRDLDDYFRSEWGRMI